MFASAIDAPDHRSFRQDRSHLTAVELARDEPKAGGRRPSTRPAARVDWKLRLVVAGLLVLPLGLGAWQNVMATNHTGYQVIQVSTGDTLWSIAAARYPNDDPRYRVGQILRLNHLSRPDVLPGQELKLPAS